MKSVIEVGNNSLEVLKKPDGAKLVLGKMRYSAIAIEIMMSKSLKVEEKEAKESGNGK